MICLSHQISCGINAGELFEIVDKMRLIEITAACRHVRPGKISSGANLLQDLLKTADASKEFRRKSHFIGKKLNEAARTDADVVSKLSHGRSGMDVAEKTQRAI